MDNVNKPSFVLKSQISYGLQIAAWISERGVSYKISKRYKDKETGGYKNSDFLNALDIAALTAHLPGIQQKVQELIEQRDRNNIAQGQSIVVETTLKEEDIPF